MHYGIHLYSFLLPPHSIELWMVVSLSESESDSHKHCTWTKSIRSPIALEHGKPQIHATSTTFTTHTFTLHTYFCRTCRFHCFITCVK